MSTPHDRRETTSRSRSSSTSDRERRGKDARIDIETLEPRRVMCANCVALDSFLAAAAAAASADHADDDAPVVADLGGQASVAAVEGDGSCGDTGGCCCQSCRDAVSPGAAEASAATFGAASAGDAGMSEAVRRSGTALSSSRAASTVPQMWLSAPSYGIRGTDAVFTVSLDKEPGDKVVSVWWKTVNGGAAAGTDFGKAGDRNALVGTVVFTGTETVKEIRVPILATALVRAPKPANFSVELYAPSNAKVVNNRAMTSVASDTPGFQIEINFIGKVPPLVQGAAKAAVNRWQSVITGDLPPVVVGGRFIDDFVMNVQMGLIGGMKSDGENGVLANAWPMDPQGLKPCIRSTSLTGNHTAYMGTTGIDPADINFAGLQHVIEHEMGHALGIGSFWKYHKFFPQFPNLKLIKGDGTDTPEYVGANAVEQYGSYYPGTKITGVPVQAYVLGHWDEDYLGTELMTPFAEDGPMPLSRVTLGALADLGYQVNYAKAGAWSPDGALASTAGQERTGSGASGSVASSGLLTNMAWAVVVTIRQTQAQEPVGTTPSPASGALARQQTASATAPTGQGNEPTDTTPRRTVIRTTLAPAPKPAAAPATVTSAAFRGYR